MASIKIKYKNEEYSYESGIKLLDILSDLKIDAIAGTIDNKLVSLNFELNHNCTIDFVNKKDELGNKVYERGLHFLFVKAVREVLNADVKILSSILNYDYFEILSNKVINEITIEKIKIKMRELKEAKMEISKINVSKDDAINYFERVGQKDKALSLKYISNSTISLYKLDNTLDYFYGVMPINTSYIDNFNLKFMKDNKVVLVKPITYEKEEKLKYEKNDILYNKIREQSMYLDNINISSSCYLNEMISKNEYQNIIRTSEYTQNEQLFNITNDIMKNKNIKVLLIAGLTGSGKQTVAQKLSSYLVSKGYSPIFIPLSSFLIPDNERIIDEDSLGINKKEDYNIASLNNKISDLLSGKECTMPGYKDKISMNDKSIIVLFIFSKNVWCLLHERYTCSHVEHSS